MESEVSMGKGPVSRRLGTSVSAEKPGLGMTETGLFPHYLQPRA